MNTLINAAHPPGPLLRNPECSTHTTMRNG